MANISIFRFFLGVATGSLFTLIALPAHGKSSDVQNQQTRGLTVSLPSEINNHPLAVRLSDALQMAHQAGQAILTVKDSRNLQTQMKKDSTPVTQADHASNQVICLMIHSLYPDDGILSEETISGNSTLNNAIKTGVNAKWTWVLDPLDGTKAFIKSTGQNASNLDPRYQGKHYGVHVGLLHEGVPVLGVNYYPEIDTFYFALDHFAYTQQGDAPAEHVIHKPVSGIQPILNPTSNEREMVDKIYQKLLGEKETSQFNTQGLFLDSFGYKMACIAEGRQCNVYIAPAGGPGFWDICSMFPFVQAVGGQVTDWEGNPIDFRDMRQSGLLPKGVIISMNPELHKQIIAIIAEMP